jgi:hypothetical protein
MSAVTHGTAHLYGIQGGVGVITNATVLDFSLDSSLANVGETMNELGNVIERRMDDLTKEGTITIQPRSGFTPLVPGTVYTYNSVKFIITSEGRKETQKGFVTLTYNILTSEYITLA